MRWGAAFLLFCCAALGQNTPTDTGQLPEALSSALAQVKAKTHITILLPSKLPQPFADAKYATVESASEDEYGISLYYELHGGDSAFAASFSADSNPDHGPKEMAHVQEVNLSHGLVGYFREVSCGGSCAPANLWWEEDHVFYGLQLELPADLPDTDQQKEMISVANSAIMAGPR